MTCRSLLWIAAAAVSIGAATSTPSPATAAPDTGWTIDAPAPGAIVESKHLTIHGTAAHEAGIDTVTVTIVPQGLPPQCGPTTGPATLNGGGYVIELDVDCNGPYEIHVAADSNGDTATAEPHTIGVAERPPQPLPPTTDVTAQGGLHATWDPGHDPDTNGTILIVNYRQDHHDPGIDHATLPPTDRNAAVSIRTLRWGPDGPDTTSIPSPESGGTYIAPNPLRPPEKPEPQSDPDPGPPPGTPPPPTPQGSTGPSARPTTTSTPSTAASTTVPAEPSAEDAPTPTAVVRDAEPAPATEERAVSTAAPAGGLVRTSDDRSAGLVAPLGLALVLAAAAALTWHRHHTPRTVSSDPHAPGTRSR